jgi:hypothetical protein
MDFDTFYAFLDVDTDLVQYPLGLAYSVYGAKV